MGKTVPTYRMALETEIAKWRGSDKGLRAEDHEPFETMMDACRSYASAASNATNPVLFEPMTLPILLDLQKRLSRLKKELDELKQK